MLTYFIRRILEMIPVLLVVSLLVFGFIKLLPGDQVAMNGNPQALVPSPNGFAMLQLPPGDYRFSISNNGQTRDQSITVDREGVWLLNPQS